MSPLVVWAVLLQGLLPLGATLAVAIGPRRSRAVWLSQLFFAATLISAGALAGLWLALPWYLPWVMAALLAIAAVGGRKRGRAGCWPGSRLAWVGFAIAVGLSILLAAVSGYALLGRRPPPGQPIELSFPLVGGPFLIAAGGSNTLINPHLGTLAPTFRAYRGQSYAVDVVGIGRWGSRSQGFFPADPDAYAIFGAPVGAPCEGEIIRAFDEAPDMRVPERSRIPLEGNHVILDCDSVWVVLAHLRSGSVRVAAGDTVTRGSPIGEVGNSGQSDEPHLHIHAQRPGTSEAPLSGEPLPLRFGDQWPVRNQRMTGRLP